MESIPEWAAKVVAGDLRAIGRAITAIENGEEAGIPLLKELFPQTGRGVTVGVTGAPGTGKSTLVDQLARRYRQEDKNLGIVAVDPTSPFTGGAILGDRIRMSSLSTDEGIYIRSMANRGRMGGLASATLDTVSVLDAAGKDIILVETVGVGQDEVEIAELADVTLVLLVPGMGDSLQSFKAGVMEIADIFVVNKADLAGADRVAREVTALLEISPAAGPWTPTVVLTSATHGEGISRLMESIRDFLKVGQEGELMRERLRRRWRARLKELLRSRLEILMTRRVSDGDLDRYTEQIAARRQDPYTVIEKMLEQAGWN